MKILKGNLIYSTSVSDLHYLPDGYLVIDGSQIVGCFAELPDDYAEHDIEDYGTALIIPGFVDVHLHAPQYRNVGLGIDKELLDWLSTYTFPEEARFADREYALPIYRELVHELWKKGTTSAVIFGSIHQDSTLALVDLYKRTGLRAYIGKVNMDRNSPDFYIEDTAASLADTETFIAGCGNHPLVKPIITPRFVPTCTPELMEGLGELARKYDVKIQSHLSENQGEIEWVKALHPECGSYYDVYKRYGLIREGLKTVMAHCVWSDAAEIEALRRDQVLVAHAPFSNGNLSSGIAPIATLLDAKVPVGLCSDISGGHELFMGRIIAEAAAFSRMYHAHVDAASPILPIEALFYMATLGGGSFFGSVGTFLPGYQADLLVIHDEELNDSASRSLPERLQRFLYNGSERQISLRMVAGRTLSDPLLLP
ncbi:MAG: amidohydrolase family protein [Lachnospiraceae bacterium]|nr:amidohydrolase family protein [Lachnospiraceae bacterium]MDY5741446.1 amidohydrolase family protein [Lachnospiraceae bacterium]